MGEGPRRIIWSLGLGVRVAKNSCMEAHNDSVGMSGVLDWVLMEHRQDYEGDSTHTLVT